MASDLDKSGEGRDTIGQKLDSLSASVDERFDAVDAALVEQRQYTEFAFDKLSNEMRSGFAAVNGRLDGVDGKFNDVDGRFNRVDRRLNGIDDRLEGIDRRLDRADRRFDAVDGRFDGIDARFDRMDDRFDGMDGRFDRLERKLDQFIDTQSKTNELVERRLTALEPRSGPE
jgi:archaellum component FlaC